MKSYLKKEELSPFGILDLPTNLGGGYPTFSSVSRSWGDVQFSRQVSKKGEALKKQIDNFAKETKVDVYNAGQE